MVRLLTVVVLLCSSATSSAAAQDDRFDVLGLLARCRAIDAPAARLACFDEAAGRIDTAVKARDVTIVDKRDVQKARRSLFGFSLPRIPLFGVGGRSEDRRDDSDVAELNTTIASVRPLANGRLELRLTDEEAIWQTTDPLPFPPKSGAAVRIRRGALGNYFIAIKGERSVRGIRVR